MLQKLMQQYKGPPAISVIPHPNLASMGSFFPADSATIDPNAVYREEEKSPYTVPGVEMPLGLENLAPLPNLLEVDPQSIKPKVDTTSISQPPVSGQVQPPVDNRSGFEKFVQSDFYKSLQDLVSGMAAAPAGGSGWDTLAHGVTKLSEGNKQREQVNQTVEYLKSKGYGEEEARFMASNPKMLSAILTGSNSPQLLPGFEWYDNPETRQREMRPIKGSPQELEYNKKKREEQEYQFNKQKNIAVTDVQLTIGMNAINNAIHLIKDKLFSTGLPGHLTRGIGGSPAYDLDQEFQTIKGGALKNVFESLKSLSNNGAIGVGPISNTESEMLVSTFGALDTGRSKEKLLETLGMLQQTLKILEKFNKQQLHNLATGQPINTPLEIASEYSIHNPMGKQGSEDAPTMSIKEVTDRDDITIFRDPSTSLIIEKEEVR